MRRATAVGQFARQNALALVALFLVLTTGGAMAVAQGSGPGRDSIGSKELKKDAVGAAEIKNNAIGAKELKADSVGTAELAPGAVGPINEAVAYGGDGKLDALPVNQQPSSGFVTVDTISWTEASGGAGPGVTEASGGAAGGRTALMSGALVVTNPKDGGGDATVTVRVLVDGVGQAVTYRQTIPEASIETVPVQILSGGLTQGAHSAQLQMQSADQPVSATNGSFGVVSFGPIFNPPAS